MPANLLTKAPAYRGQSAKVTHRWFVASSDRVKVMFGLRPEQKWPAEGVDSRVIDGVTVLVMALNPHRRKDRTHTHRVVCACPVCNKTLTLVRLGHHLAVLTKYEVPNA